MFKNKLPFATLMQTKQSWGLFNSTIAHLSKPQLRDFLYLEGSFNFPIQPEKEVPPGLYGQVNNVETIVRDNFPSSVLVEGVQTPNTRNPENQAERYKALIWASKDNNTLTTILMHVTHIMNVSTNSPARYLHPQLEFLITLPLNDYKESSTKTVKNLWPTIYEIKCQEKLPAKKMAEIRKFSPETILLVRDGSPIMIGFDALSEVGLTLPKKGTYIQRSGFYRA